MHPGRVVRRDAVDEDSSRADRATRCGALTALTVPASAHRGTGVRRTARQLAGRGLRGTTTCRSWRACRRPGPPTGAPIPGCAPRPAWALGDREQCLVPGGEPPPARTANRPDRYRRAPELRARNRKRAVPRDGRAHTTHIERPDRAGLRGARAESPVWRLARVPAGQSLPGRGQSAHPGRVTATQAEKHVAKELNVSPEDVDAAVQEAACEVS